MTNNTTKLHIVNGYSTLKTMQAIPEEFLGPVYCANTLNARDVAGSIVSGRINQHNFIADENSKPIYLDELDIFKRSSLTDYSDHTNPNKPSFDKVYRKNRNYLSSSCFNILTYLNNDLSQEDAVIVLTRPHYDTMIKSIFNVGPSLFAENNFGLIYFVLEFLPGAGNSKPILAHSNDNLNPFNFDSMDDLIIKSDDLRKSPMRLLF